MILTILKIRMIQVYRIFEEIGLFRALFLLAVLALVFLIILPAAIQGKKPYYVSLISGIIIFLIHISRKDKQFIKTNFNLSYFIFLTEYVILSIPIIITCLIFNDLKNAIILFVVCLFIPWIYLSTELNNISSLLKILLNPFKSNLKFKLNIKIPINNPKSFEWISGFRRYFIIIFPVYTLLLAFSFKIYVAPVGLIILSIILTGFYFQGESREFIELFSNNYKTFLRQKISICLKYLLILFIPIISISLIFQPGTWYYIIGALIIAMFIQIITIIFKYALFSENSDLGHNGIIVFINILCILLPFLWPLPIIMGTRYYFKAQNNLKKYLNDIN